jgi:rare lipoprotein A
VRSTAFLALLLAAGCAALPEPAPTRSPEVAKPAPAPGKGGYYKDDGPGDNPPANLDRVADATPRLEPLHRYANRPYSRFGKDYVPLTAVGPFRQTGLASWYGRRFHGQPTSSGEVYDMYAMTAAHPTLPIPSYARVSNPANGRSVVVRINDRGPFHSDRIIDLSYVAAWKLGLVASGSGLVTVEAIVPGKVAESLRFLLPIL